MLINFCLPCFPQLSGENKSCLLPCPSSLILSTLTDSLKYIKIWEMYWVAGNWNHKTNYKAPHKKKKLSLFRMKLSDLSQITSIIISYSHRSRAYCQQTSLFQLMWIHEKFFFFFLVAAAPAAYGSSWVRGWIRAAAASLLHSHSNMGSELHLWPMPQLVAIPDP